MRNVRRESLLCHKQRRNEPAEKCHYSFYSRLLHFRRIQRQTYVNVSECYRNFPPKKRKLEVNKIYFLFYLVYFYKDELVIVIIDKTGHFALPWLINLSDQVWFVWQGVMILSDVAMTIFPTH